MPQKTIPRIALIAPASHLSSEEEVLQVAASLEAKGFTAVYSQDTYRTLSAKERADIFLQYAQDQTICALWALRGGEGCADIIPYLDEKRSLISGLPKKYLIGFSDITALLMYFARHSSWVAVHGPVASQWRSGVKVDCLHAVCDILLNRSAPLMFPLTRYNSVSADLIEAPLLVGNLTLLQLSLKECWEFDAAGSVLLIEDWNEKGYRLHRTLKHFQRIGKLQGIKALIFGDCEAAAQVDLVQAGFIKEELLRFAASCDYPVFATRQIGHGEENWPLIENSLVSLCSVNAELTTRAHYSHANRTLVIPAPTTPVIPTPTTPVIPAPTTPVIPASTTPVIPAKAGI